MANFFIADLIAYSAHLSSLNVRQFLRFDCLVARLYVRRGKKHHDL